MLEQMIIFFVRIKNDLQYYSFKEYYLYMFIQNINKNFNNSNLK